MKPKLIRSTLILIGLFGLCSSAHTAKLMVDVNQITKSEILEVFGPRQASLRADGTWALLGNTPNVTENEWNRLIGFIQPSKPRYLVSEDVYGKKDGYSSVHDTFGFVSGAMVYKAGIPGGEILNNSEINVAAANHGGKIIVLARSYTGERVQKVNTALNNSNVVGVVYEIATGADDGTSGATIVKNLKIADGVRAALYERKKAFVLLSPGRRPTGSNYKNQVMNTATQLKAELGGDSPTAAWANPNFYLVVAAYERWDTEQHGPGTEVTFLGPGGVSDALYALRTITPSGC